MAIIPKYSLNEKFENGKKPPQWDFWAWQDSYWHKEEKIPTSAVEGLDATLLKKADLVDGMVPESQLPFSVVTSEVLALGNVEVIDNEVKLSVHSSGANKVRVKGKLITRMFPNEWPFTPIAGNGIKVLRGYAVKNEDDFFMVEGAELPEMTDPEIPENALQLFRLTISSAGVIVEEETEEVFKYRSDDNWRPLIINTNAGVWLQFGGTGASSFNITVSGFVTTPKIVGLSTKVTKNIWNGKDILLYIDSDIPVAIVKDQTLPTAPNATFINFAEDYILQPKSYNLIKQKGNQIVVVKYGGGSANFPAGGSDGEVLLKSGTGGVWSSIIKGVEFLGNAWLKLKIISFQGYTIAQKNAIVSPTEGMLIYQNEAPKGFQKYEGGAWSAIGSNISNADLSNISVRKFLQGNTFTWDTAGFLYYLKGLVDKTGNGTYTKVVVVHPTTGETVTRDFADPAATTLAVQNANTTQKTAMRTALLGSAVPASPIVIDVFPFYIQKGTQQFNSILGLNLTLLEPTNIFFTDGGGTIRYASAFQNISAQNVLLSWNLPIDTVEGIYDLKINTGGVAQGISTGKIKVMSTTPRFDLLQSMMSIKFKTGYTSNGIARTSNNLMIVSTISTNAPNGPSDGFAFGTVDNEGEVTIKTDNIFLGAVTSSWEIIFDAIPFQTNGTYGNLYPWIGITETSNADFTNPNSIIMNAKIDHNGTKGFYFNAGANSISYLALKQIIIRKTNDKLQIIGISTSDGVIIQNSIIDTSKNYGIFLRGWRSVGNYQFTETLNIRASLQN